MLAGKLDCAGVCRHSWLSTTSGVASRFRSMTIAHALAVGFVADVGDALDALVLGGFGDLLDQAVLADLVGDFGEHDRAAVAAAFLDVWRERIMIEPRPVV